MKKKIKIILILLILIIIFVFAVKINFGKETETTKLIEIQDEYFISEKRDIVQTLTANGEVKSGKIESLKLNTSYKYWSMCAEENQIIKAGENLLKYSNGKYLVAPYDLIITDYYVPNVNKVCASSHYIKVSSVEDLYMDINISEGELPKVKVGQEVDLVINYDSSQKYSGIITKINETGTYNNGIANFAAIVSLKNDGNLKVGMSANCTIIIEKNENLLCVPIAAVNIEDDKRYVKVIDESGNINEKIVETGKADANYVQIKSGLTLNEKVFYQTQTVSNIENEEKTSSNLFETLFGRNPMSRGGRF